MIGVAIFRVRGLKDGLIRFISMEEVRGLEVGVCRLIGLEESEC